MAFGTIRPPFLIEPPGCFAQAAFSYMRLISVFQALPLRFYIPLPVVWMQMPLRYCAGNSGRQIPRKKKSEELLYSSLNITNWKSNCTFAAEERDIGSINVTVPYIVEQHQIQVPVKIFLVQPDGLHKFGDGKTT